MEMVIIEIGEWTLAAPRKGFREEDGILRIDKAWDITSNVEFGGYNGYRLKDGKLAWYSGDEWHRYAEEFNDVSIKEWKYYYSLTV